MGQFFGQEKITNLFKNSSTIATLPAGTTVRIGGQAYSNNSAINCTTSTSGFGGIDTGAAANFSFYYVYLVVQAGVMGLVCSLSSDSPLGFAAFKKVGAFYTGNAGIHRAYKFGEYNIKSYKVEVNSGTTIRSEGGAQRIFPNNPNWVASLSRSGQNNAYLTINFDPIYNLALPPLVNAGSESGGGSYVGSPASATISSVVVVAVNPNILLTASPMSVEVVKVGVDAIQPDWSL